MTPARKSLRTNRVKKDSTYPMGKAIVRTNMADAKIASVKIGDDALLIVDTVEGKATLRSVMVDRANQVSKASAGHGRPADLLVGRPAISPRPLGATKEFAGAPQDRERHPRVKCWHADDPQGGEIRHDARALMIPWKSKHGWKCKYKLDWVEEVPRSPGDVPKGRGHPPGECADLSRPAVSPNTRSWK